MIAHCPGRPTGSKRFLSQFDCVPKHGSIEPLLHKFEGVATMKMFSRSRIFRAHRNHIDIQHFTDQVALAILVNKCPEVPKYLQSSRLVPTENHSLPVKRIASLSVIFRIAWIKLASGIVS